MLRNGIEGRIKARIKKLKSRKARRYFQLNIGHPKSQQELERNYINQTIRTIEDLFPTLIELLKKVRPHFNNIWDQNKIVASYLLLGKSFKTLEAVIEEMKKGNPTSAVELARSGCEAVDLVFLFLSNDGDTYLRKWFGGKIISNNESRKAFERSITEMFPKSAGSYALREMKSDVYWIYSLYTHSGYGAILDMVDVYYEDFDFSGYAGFHYTRQYLHLAENLLVNILLGLKNIFLITVDLEGIATVEKYLKQFHLHFASPREISDWISPSLGKMSKNPKKERKNEKDIRDRNRDR